jgi:hypothetical protein
MKRAFLLATAASALAAAAPAHANTVLIINGNAASSIAAPIAAAGFTVVQDSFRPGAISDHLSVPNDISEIWVWNDGTFGNTGSPAVPALAFDAADLSDLQTFDAAHKGWIMDGLSWRGNANSDEQGFTQNEALALAGDGGGIVLGADDASGAAIVQHVNQVAALFNFNLFDGVYITEPSSQHYGGSLLSSPNAINPGNVVGTTTYSEIPNGLQPNGVFLETSIFGSGTPYPGYGSPPLPDASFNGVSYPNVNHLVTTNIAGGGINGTPEPATWSMLILGLGMAGAALRRRWAGA